MGASKTGRDRFGARTNTVLAKAIEEHLMQHPEIKFFDLKDAQTFAKAYDSLEAKKLSSALYQLVRKNRIVYHKGKGLYENLIGNIDKTKLMLEEEDAKLLEEL